ncbi:type IV secretion protein Rhs [Christiangramia fulva]|uniref:Type IV secretion protein Rhs n=1 Tax=Christiangramia fulva TaxID=2126553 RepID=A0A2R3Z5S3_9FLAO|nr:VCBS repeat-containing protein [Christiangramia fulva]AVR45598.1 type IV secretion protein Rhs [Christiangramia fulva]
MISFNSNFRFLFICISLFLIGCNKERDGSTMFDSLDPAKTKVAFTNEVIETKELNVMQYEYMYNGAGVAIGDLNGDNLPDLYLTGNIVENKLYLNKGNFEFEDVTQQSGVKGKENWSTGTSMADVNSDGLLDIYVCYSGLGTKEDRSNQLFINQGPDKNGVPKFIDKAKDFGLDAVGSNSTQAAFLDYDLDGDLDVFLLNHSKEYYSPFYNSTKLRNTRHPYYGNILYRNDNGSFVNVSEEAGIHGSGLNFGLGVSISDVNDDNWPDIYVSNDYVEQDFLYLNNGDGTFTETSKKSFGHISKFSMGNDATDINNDGQIDLVTLDMIPEDNYRQKILKGPDQYDLYHLAIDSGYHKQQMRNMFQLNQGIDKEKVPRFSEIGQLTGISNTDWSWAPLVADFDSDGLKDLYITNGYLKDFTNKDFMKFEVDQAVAKVRRKGGELFGKKGKKQYSDVIYELVKKMSSTKIPNYMFKNTNGLNFKDVTQEWGLSAPTVSTGAAYGDLDNDGDLDLVVSNTNQPVSIYRNNADKLKNNYLEIDLKGEGKNTLALGSKIWVSTDSSNQFIEHYNVRGYQSSVDPKMFFGLGKSHKVNVKIQWPDGRLTIRNNVKSNQVLQLDQADAKISQKGADSLPNKKFFEQVNNSGIVYEHKENKYIDFKVNRLALKQSSMSGPKMAVADVNGDNLDDLFIGGALGQPDALFISDPKGKFKKVDVNFWSKTEAFESTGSTFFDADGDGDMDLYVVDGGSQKYSDPKVLMDRLYINQGNGKFEKAKEGVLPIAYSNGSIVVAGDYDNDGDQDLFIGGGSEPGDYPNSSLGGILRNDSNLSKGEIKFTIATREINEKLRQPGIVTDAIWTDLNDDDWLDLVLVGEWMPIKVYINNNGKLIEKTNEYGLGKSNGLWQSIENSDIDGDGDMDLIVGNMSPNLPFKVSESEPLEAYIGDFRGDGVMSPVISSYILGERYPIASLDELQDAFPMIKKRYLKYEQYANANLREVFGPEQLEKAKHLEVYELKSIYLENKGNHFEKHELPMKAQFSAIEGINIFDFNNDNIQDILLTGNYYPFKVEYGPVDASKGLLLLGKGNGEFDCVPENKLGVWIEGDVRDAEFLSNNKGIYIIVSKNSDSIQVLKLNKLVKR